MVLVQAVVVGLALSAKTDEIVLLQPYSRRNNITTSSFAVLLPN